VRYSGGNVFRSGGKYKGRLLTSFLLTAALAMMIPFLMNNTNKIHNVVIYVYALSDELNNSDYHMCLLV
jgi:hypothetical protein